LRIIVLTSGRLLIAAGLVLILTLDLDASLRAAGSLIWLTLGRFELQGVQRGFDSCTAIRVFSDGQIKVLNNDQEWMSGTLQSGSLVLPKLAWLRLQAANGTAFAELLRGDARESQNWRRMQVIWRHIGA
jgi:hypothetical protein